ncbi:hypothetical protein K8Q94_00145 [Candidatus Nomurabacteria bacterium]|nr:hypothetical protein [Candidatus Nomurabacteria bacterium]
MLKDLKKEVKSIILNLKREEKLYLARAIEQNWDKTMLEYSKYLNSYKANGSLEEFFKKALTQELLRLEYKKIEISKIIRYFEQNRNIQTGPHISPAGKPRFFFINWLASLSLTSKDYFGVAMFSGVPFSNKTRPGRLCSKNEDINLMPSLMQDELVYRNKIPKKMKEVINSLPKEFTKILPEFKENDSYTKWALESSKKLESKFLNGKTVFFDFNEVVTNYLILIIKDNDHPIHKLLFSKKERNETIKEFKEMVFFYGMVEKGKYKTMESFYLKDGYLESENRKIELNPENLKKELENNLCPGLVIGFLIFSFLNKFQCFGSFAQIEYLPLYRDKFSKLSFLKKYKIFKSPAGALTTGGFPDNSNLHILDIVQNKNISKKMFNQQKDRFFGEAIITIKNVLLNQNYSLNLIKK